MHSYILTHISLSLLFWDLGKQCRPDQTPQNAASGPVQTPQNAASGSAASNQDLYCLLTGISIQNQIKMKRVHLHP